MNQKRKRQILVLLALALTVFAPKELECVRGGLDDGTAPAFNCVHALFPARELEFTPPAWPLSGDDDLELPQPAREPGANAPPSAQAVVQPVARGGKLVETAYQAALTRVPGWPAAVLPVAPLLRPPFFATLPPADFAGHAREIRGPPLPPAVLLTSSPRAPPFA